MNTLSRHSDLRCHSEQSEESLRPAQISRGKAFIRVRPTRVSPSTPRPQKSSSTNIAPPNPEESSPPVSPPPIFSPRLKPQTRLPPHSILPKRLPAPPVASPSRRHPRPSPQSLHRIRRDQTSLGRSCSRSLPLCAGRALLRQGPSLAWSQPPPALPEHAPS